MILCERKKQKVASALMHQNYASARLSETIKASANQAYNDGAQPGKQTASPPASHDAQILMRLRRASPSSVPLSAGEIFTRVSY